MKIFVFSLYLPYQPILARHEAIMVFFFLNFLAIFFEFSITRRLLTDQNDNFLYLTFLAFSNVFWIEMKP